MASDHNRRKFLGAAAAAFTIVPRHVLGGPGVVAPSDKITLGHIGVGTEGLREMTSLLASPEIQIVAVCDPNRYPIGYRDWSTDGIASSYRKLLGKPNWTAGRGVVPGGREVAKDLIETYYANVRSSDKYKGCAEYADFRDMLENQKDMDAVKIMTPDHLHAVISIAAMRKGKHVIMHKPISNRLKEAKLVIETARQTGVATHFMPWDANGSMEQVMAWIKDGSIGQVREVHNWTNRPVWEQYATIPTDKPPVPEGFDWDLWLGPEADRPYHPDYTHMVFRGWYDFGGGSMADMGHYSLWTVFNALELSGPTSIEPMLSHQCGFNGVVATTFKNDYSFPTASCVRFKYPARGARPAVDLFWYDGGIRPATPDELDEDNEQFPAEAMMFVGDKGKILAGFHVDQPRLIPKSRMQGYPQQVRARREHEDFSLSPGLKQWMAACKGGKQSPGNFTNAWPISEAVNLYSVALRSRQRIRYDADSMTVTNNSDANRYLSREYRPGWAPQTA